MSLSEQEGPMSPEELQAATQEAYYSIPEYLPVKKDLPIEEIIMKTLQHASHRLGSEMRPILVGKLDKLISKSPTTSHYKELMHLLVDLVCVVGRESNADYTLAETLQIKDSRTGIYTLEGASKGEKVLFDYAIDQFTHSVRTALEMGHDPIDPDCEVNVFRDYSIVEFKDFLLEWYKEHERLYGKSPGGDLFDDPIE